MSVGYGSSINLNQLDRSSIGTIPEKKKPGNGLIGFFRILITVGEIGLALAFPEIAPAIAITGAVANEGLDVISGNFTIFGTFVNVASVALPIVAASRATKTAKEVTEVIEKNAILVEKEVTANLSKLGFASNEVELLLPFFKPQGQAATTRSLVNLAEELKKIKNITTSQKIAEFIETFESKARYYVTALSEAGVKENSASTIYRAFQDASNEVMLGTSAPLRNKKSIWKYLGTRKFNDRVVQNVQLIDPNDLGRAPVELAYRTLKKKMTRAFKGLNKLDKVEKAFIKTGGVSVESTIILGIKRIKRLGLQTLVMISFRQEATNHKRPVLVWMSELQIGLFLKAPSKGKYYLDHFAVSRGGAPVGASKIFGTKLFAPDGKGRLTLNPLLSFIPVQQLKNILSIVSNIVENISDMNDGTYSKNYMTKLKRSFINTAITRSFRLGFKVGVGGAISKKYSEKWGKFIGIELQRIGTNIIGAGLKNAVAGKSFSKGLKQNAIKGLSVSVRSHSLKKLRKRDKSNIVVQALSQKRKWSFIGRVPNAVQPKRPGLKIAGIKIR